jgi:hypothetical protein
MPAHPYRFNHDIHSGIKLPTIFLHKSRQKAMRTLYRCSTSLNIRLVALQCVDGRET